MKNEYYTNSNDYINRWVISYADFVTMLLALFMVMFATNSMGEMKVKDVNKSIQKVFASKTIDKNEEAEVVAQKEQKSTDGILENSGKTILDGGDGILDTKQLIEEIEKEIQLNTSVKVIKSDRGVVIRLNDTMLFDPGSAIIKQQAKLSLAIIAGNLVQCKNPILIDSPTDSMPLQNERFPSNWELSTARASNIIKYLTQSHGFPPGRLSAVGYGEYMPIEKNTTPQGRAKNRRVDIIVLSSDKK